MPAFLGKERQAPQSARNGISMTVPSRKNRPDLALIAAGIALSFPALAQSDASIAGAYICETGCRLTDAAPSVEIDGSHATCMNELGGIYHGTLLSADSVYCFGKVGKLSEDGKSIRWDSGMVWKRLPEPAHP
jgi:hypothetical protein